MLPTLPPGLPQFQSTSLQQPNSSGLLPSTTSTISSIVGGLTSLSLSSSTDDPSSAAAVAYSFTPPPRPSFGTEGKVIKLRANHFTIQIPKGFIYHYTVNIQPDKCPKRINRLVRRVPFLNKIKTFLLSL